MFHFRTGVDNVLLEQPSCRRTARRSGPAVALHQSPAVVFHSLRLAVLRDVQVKAVGAVRKEQHIVYGSQLGLLCVSGTTCRPVP